MFLKLTYSAFVLDVPARCILKSHCSRVMFVRICSMQHVILITSMVQSVDSPPVNSEHFSVDDDDDAPLSTLLTKSLEK